MTFKSQQSQHLAGDEHRVRTSFDPACDRLKLLGPLPWLRDVCRLRGFEEADQTPYSSNSSNSRALLPVR
jgi:hypothetical protein